MVVLYTLLVALAVIAAVVFSALVLLTGKGDAMNGGGSVRTTFKGKASFDDIISRWTLGTGIAFMAIVLLVDIVAKGLGTPGGRITPTAPADATPPPVSAPAANVPAANVPAPTTPAPSTASNLPSNTTTAPEAGAPATNVPATDAPATSAAPTTVPTDSGPATNAPSNAPSNSAG